MHDTTVWPPVAETNHTHCPAAGLPSSPTSGGTFRHRTVTHTNHNTTRDYKRQASTSSTQQPLSLTVQCATSPRSSRSGGSTAARPRLLRRFHSWDPEGQRSSDVRVRSQPSTPRATSTGSSTSTSPREGLLGQVLLRNSTTARAGTAGVQSQRDPTSGAHPSGDERSVHRRHDDREAHAAARDDHGAGASSGALVGSSTYHAGPPQHHQPLQPHRQAAGYNPSAHAAVQTSAAALHSGQGDDAATLAHAVNNSAACRSMTPLSFQCTHVDGWHRGHGCSGSQTQQSHGTPCVQPSHWHYHSPCVAAGVSPPSTSAVVAHVSRQAETAPPPPGSAHSSWGATPYCRGSSTSVHHAHHHHTGLDYCSHAVGEELSVVGVGYPHNTSMHQQHAPMHTAAEACEAAFAATALALSSSLRRILRYAA